MDSVENWLQRAEKTQLEVNLLLAELGAAPARVILLSDVQKKLSGAPIDVQEYFREAIVCLQNELTRSAIVVSWSGFFSLFCEQLHSHKEAEIHKIRPKWKFNDSIELKEAQPEAQIIEVAKEVGYIKNPKKRMLDGWLSQRNQCAHPTVYRPTINTGIGYVDSMIDETVSILNKGNFP